MATSLRTGQVIWTEIADANGIVKTRPAIIVTPDEKISTVGKVDVVAVTSQVPDLLPEDYVLLPWHAQGHPRTGLKCKCAAVCSWLNRISTDEIQGIAGVVSGPVLFEILTRIEAYNP